MEHDPELCADVIAGGIDKYVKQQGRNTVMQNVEHDETLVGYARVAGPDACPFCKTMSSQGFHFKSRATAMSGAKGDMAGQFHAYCNCGLAVAFKNAKGRIRAEGLDGTDIENWDPDELYREYKEAGWKFGHNRKREYLSRRASKYHKDAPQVSVEDVEDMPYLSLCYVNSSEELAKRSKHIVPLDDYEDVVVHCDGFSFSFNNLDAGNRHEKERTVSVLELSAMLDENPNHKGGDIRLIACSAGKYDDGAAQILANIRRRKVLAPLQDVNVGDKGELYVFDRVYDEAGQLIPPEPEVLSKENQAKMWRVFEPEER